MTHDRTERIALWLARWTGKAGKGVSWPFAWLSIALIRWATERAERRAGR